MEKYLKDNMIPRKLRWDIPINDSLKEDEDVNEWFSFFSIKGKEVLEFLIKWKQRKLGILEKQIKDLLTRLEPMKDTAEFVKLSNDLNKSMQRKDLETKNTKKKKYLRDLGDY